MMVLRTASLVVLLAVLSTTFSVTAGASAWHSNLGMSGFTNAFTATAGSSTVVRASSTRVMTCASSTVSGSLAGTGTSTGATYVPPAVIASGTGTGSLTLGTCMISGTSYTVQCNGYSLSLLASNSYAGNPTYATAAGGATIASGGSAATLSAACSVRLGTSEFCRITGGVGLQYVNPSPISTGTNGRLWLGGPNLGSYLTTANGTSGTCPLGAGSATLTGAGGDALIYTVTSAAPQPAFWFGSP